MEKNREKGKRQICRLAKRVRNVPDLNNILSEQRRKVALRFCPEVPAIFRSPSHLIKDEVFL